MQSGGPDGGEDLELGWHEVKKKHRSGTKPAVPERTATSSLQNQHGGYSTGRAWNEQFGPYGSGPVEIVEDVESPRLCEAQNRTESSDVILSAGDKSELSELTNVSEKVSESPLSPVHGVLMQYALDASGSNTRADKQQSEEGSVSGDVSLGESKERFRERLWCFLFENLNRAIDELYLLCELECDMEQIDEAMLVLKEAASDFRELKSRVERFDITKRSCTSTMKEPITIKSDHRRPHALSWEVRRMTTSPLRAEVLSSSLEAFRNIQLDIALKHVGPGRTPGHLSTLFTGREAEREKQESSKGDAWKEKRNWEEILRSPSGVHRRAAEKTRVLHDKLMSPEKRRRSVLDVKREAEEKHARAQRIRRQLESERAQRLQRTTEKLSRASERQAVRSSKLREVMNARHQRSESRHEAHLAQVAKRAGDETIKVNEVRFITSLNEENKKLILRQKLQDSEVRRAEKLQAVKTRQREELAREEAATERRRLIEAEKLQRLTETQRRKEEVFARREEERKASSAAREARAIEQLRRKETRARARREEAELLAQRLDEKLRESEQRRKFYLEQIREKASSIDFRDQTSSSPMPSRRSSSVASRDLQPLPPTATRQQQPLKRRVKKIRQRLMALKHEFVEAVPDNLSGVGYRPAAAAAAKSKIGRWLQDLQKLRQMRKDGTTASIGLIIADIIKYLDGKDDELHGARQAGMLDFIALSLPASHVSKPEACQVSIHLLRLLQVSLSLPANRTYFLVQNLLPPLIPLLAASLENYIVAAASSSAGVVAEVLDGFLQTITLVISHANDNHRQLQMQDSLVDLVVSYRIVHQLRDLFALYDRPQVEGSPFPSSIILGLDLLAVLTSRYGTFLTVDWDQCKTSAADQPSQLEEPRDSEQPAVLLVLSAVAETSLVSLLSLLTAVLLQANNKQPSALSPEQGQGSYVLPSNFEEVATGVLRILNNVACADVGLLQSMLARSDLKMEFFHLISFLLTHCTNKWESADDQVGFLLLESVMLLGFFSLFHSENQAVLRWGKSPTILHKICDLPFVFFSDAELMPVLGGALVAVCYGSSQNKSIVEQELSTDMMLSLLGSCRPLPLADCGTSNGGHVTRSSRRSLRSSSKASAAKVAKTRTVKRALDYVALHRRFPASFLDAAEEFFTAQG